MSFNNKFQTATKVPVEGPFIVYDASFDGSDLQDITFLNREGKIAFRIRSNYGCTLQIPAPPKMVKRKQLDAVNATIDVTLPAEFFESSYDAIDRKQNLERAGFTVTLTDVEIPDPDA